MLINLRNAMMVGKRKPTAKDYVQNGLIAMWDGIENAGWGVHDANATVWKDICGLSPLFFEDPSAVTVLPQSIRVDCVTPGGHYRAIAGAVGFSGTASTVEICVTIDRGFIHNQNVFLGPYSAGGHNTFCVIALNSNRGFLFDDGAMYGSGTSEIGPATVSWTGSVGYKNSTLIEPYDSNRSSFFRDGYVCSGAGGTNHVQRYDIHNIRLYSRALTADEIAANYAIDKARFHLP